MQRHTAEFEQHQTAANGHVDEPRVILFGRDALWLLAVQHVAASSGFTLVGSTAVARDVPGLVQEHGPELLIADIDDSTESMEWITEARALSQGLGVVVLSADADAHRISAAFDAGASAYVLKGAAPEDLALAIRQVFEHSIFIGFTPPSSGHDQPANGPRLTRRELEVLQLVTRGASNAAVAKTLWVTEQTVKFHLSNVYRKLSVSNRTEASRWAYLHGLVGNGASGDHADPPAANGSSSSENGAGVVSAAAGGRP